MGTDFGIDPFASDFSIFGHISKAANFKKETPSDPNKKLKYLIQMAMLLISVKTQNWALHFQQEQA